MLELKLIHQDMRWIVCIALDYCSADSQPNSPVNNEPNLKPRPYYL